MAPETVRAPQSGATRVGSTDWQPDTVAQKHGAVSPYFLYGARTRRA